jgi:hypothetical protein
VQASSVAARAAAKLVMTGDPDDPIPHLELALKLGNKMLRGTENYYLAGWTYTWTTYWWELPTVVKGGYTETPVGPLAGHLGDSTAWLRNADELDYDGTQHRLIRSWRGIDAWDADLYPPAE